MTGGSDDHGTNAEPLLGRIQLPDEYVTRLTAAIGVSRRRKAVSVTAHA
jgi:hypothetical protein